MHLIGCLIWVVALADFFAANAGSVTGVERETDVVWAIGLGTFSLAALVTLSGWALLDKWNHAVSDLMLVENFR